ncbi:MAG: D-alanyl-D-alanine carboxypeptidase family protein [Bdellovibrionota bacterium]
MALRNLRRHFSAQRLSHPIAAKHLFFSPGLRSTGLFLLAFLFLDVSGASAARPKPKAAKAAAAQPAGSAKPKAAGGNRADDGEEGPANGSGGDGACRAITLMDAASGTILEERNSHEPLPPASMVKLMTMYTTLKRIHQGSIKREDMIPVSPESSKIGGSQVYLKQGEQFPLSEMMDAIMIQSANDAANAVAEYVGGNRDGFVAMMNADAAELGMKEAHFYSPHGLPPGKDQQPDVVSAHDFAILAQALMKEFPEILQCSGKLESDFREGAFKMTNHNHLLRSFPGCDGLKTGYYAQAGFSITATAERNGTRMIAVVMGCPQRKTRDAEASRLMSAGLAQFRPIALIEKGATVDATAPVAEGAPATSSLIAADSFRASVKAGEESKIVKKAEACQTLTAPVMANTRCGSLSFWLGDRELGKIGLLVPNDIPKAGMLGRLKSSIGW